MSFHEHPRTTRSAGEAAGHGLKGANNRSGETYSLKIRGGKYIPVSVESDLH